MPDSPGCAVALVRDWRTIYSNIFGMANLEYDIPITTNTVFHGASVSKLTPVGKDEFERDQWWFPNVSYTRDSD